MSNPKKTKKAVKVGGIALIQSERGSTTKQPEKNRKDGYRIRLFLLACEAQAGSRKSLMPPLWRHTQSAAKVRCRARSAQACPSLPPRGVTGARLPMRKTN